MLDFNVATAKKPAPINERMKMPEAPAPPPAARDPFDVAPVGEALKVFESEISGMLQIAENHQIVDDDSNRSGIEMAAQAKRLGKTIEDMRKDRIKPFQEFVKSINNLAKVYTEKLDRIEATFETEDRRLHDQAPA